MNQKKIIILSVIFSFILLNTILCFNILKVNFISKDIVRFHVIANSNSIEDQIIKLKVENNVNEYLKNLNKDSKESFLNALKNNENKILQISNKTIKDSNKEYSSTLKVGKIKYDKKDDMLLSMNKGTYDSACITIGEGNGKNIWSIIFPDKDTINNLKQLETIMPGISEIYEEDDNYISNTPNRDYTNSKILAIIKEYI